MDLAHRQLVAIRALGRSFGEDPQAMEAVSKLRMGCERSLHQFQVPRPGGNRVGCIRRGVAKDQIQPAQYMPAFTKISSGEPSNCSTSLIAWAADCRSGI